MQHPNVARLLSGHSEERRVGGTLREIHLLAIGGKTAGSLVIFRVQSRAYRLRLAPFSLVVFFRKEDVARLRARDAIELIAQGFISVEVK